MIDVTKRLTERMTRGRLMVELRRSLRPLAVLALGAMLGLAAWLVIISNVGSGVRGEQQTVAFEVTSANSITPGRNPVKLHGVEIGTITGVDLHGDTAVIEAKILSQHGQVHRDARAELRSDTALENMYVNITDRGTEGAGLATAADPLPAGRTSASTQIEDVLQAFDPRVRAHLSTTLRELGGGLDDRGADLREAFVGVVPFLEVVASMSRQLSHRAALTRRLVSTSATLTAELARRDADLRALVHEGANTLTTLADSSGDLDATLRRLPPALTAWDSSFAAVRGVVDDVDAALRDLRPVADRLPAGLTTLRRLSDDADPALQALRDPVRRLVPLSTSIGPLSARLDAAVRTLAPQTGAINHVTSTVAGCTNAIFGFFAWTASVTKFDDGRTLFPRGNAVGSVNSGATSARDPGTTPSGGCAPGMPKVDTP
jgi:phospholipid/cholesterol/gamma-HCH transport system substrate-binding protein